MTRLLFGFLFALTLTFVTGCGGSTEPTVVTGGPSETELDQQEEDRGVHV